MVLVEVRTDKDVHFTGAIAQNAEEEENIVLPGSCGGNAARVIVRAIAIVADQDLDWELWFWGTDLFDEADLDNDKFLGKAVFAAAEGTQIGGAGTFYSYKEGLAIPLADYDGTGEMHVSLVNRNVTGKNAGATGEIVVLFWVEPMQQS